ncbi:MAG: Arm DNA-binding domain-containing protein [Anaerovibrio sp.]|uniref:Arm DNA-binding domain-containing protein n=1 Tax=Anaerovibrio sp. TaxID=1872532 RepID=UPI0025DE3F1C|nr:Arm DNA-binding domain-containing protein [Anaerovibrio sp.]MCR5175705.1 Arm DNA-binding domain-containing protein [Anaerovibrio sp.]
MARRNSRGTNEGTVYYCEAKGYWMAQLTLAYDPLTGKRKRLSRYANTRREALEKLNEL